MGSEHKGLSGMLIMCLISLAWKLQKGFICVELGQGIYLQFGRFFVFIYESVQFSSVAQSCPTLCDSMNRSTPGLPVHHQLPDSTQTHICCVGDAIQPSHPLSSPSPPALSLSQHQSLLKESALHIRWPKYWNFSFSISPSNEYSGLIYFRLDQFDLLATQGTVK